MRILMAFCVATCVVGILAAAIFLLNFLVSAFGAMGLIFFFLAIVFIVVFFGEL